MFASIVKNAIGVTAVDVQTAPTDKVHTVLAVIVNNKLTGSSDLVAAQIKVTKSTGETIDLIAAIPPLCPGEQKTWEGKLFLQAGDKITAISDKAASIDVMTNYMEGANV